MSLAGAIKGAAAAVPLFFAVPAAAVITDVEFHGVGRVNYSHSDIQNGQIGPPVGKIVYITGRVHLGDVGANHGYPPVPVNNFTGRFVLDEGAVFDHTSYFSYQITGADYASSLDPANNRTYGTLDFVAGRLKAIDLSYVGDPDQHGLNNNSWSYSFHDGDNAEWGGSWGLRGVPEPSTWTMLLLGFGATGVLMRRHRSEPACKRDPVSGVIGVQ